MSNYLMSRTCTGQALPVRCSGNGYAVVSRILGHRIQVALLQGNGEQLVFAFHKFRYMLGNVGLGDGAVMIHHFRQNTPAFEIEPAVAFHCQFHPAFVLNGEVQIVGIIL